MEFERKNIRNMKAHDSVIKYEQMYKGWFFNHCHNSETAKDLYQDFILKVLEKEKGKSFINKYAQTKWLWLVAQSVFVDWTRLENRRKSKFFSVDKYGENYFFRQESFEYELEKEDAIKEVEVAMKKLPAEQEVVYRMRAVAKIPFKTIADIFGISINTAIGQMRYARINLKKNLTLSN